MKRMCAILLVSVSTVAVAFTGTMAQQTSVVPAADFPQEIAAENYVPSLYYSVPQAGTDRLVAALDFPYETVDLCYCPSLYYQVSEVTVGQALK